MTRKQLADIMSRAEMFRDELNVQREDISNEFLALANGFKSIGGNVYIKQTYDLISVCFDCENRNEGYLFFTWAIQYCDK